MRSMWYVRTVPSSARNCIFTTHPRANLPLYMLVMNIRWPLSHLPVDNLCMTLCVRGALVQTKSTHTYSKPHILLISET